MDLFRAGLELFVARTPGQRKVKGESLKEGREPYKLCGTCTKRRKILFRWTRLPLGGDDVVCLGRGGKRFLNWGEEDKTLPIFKGGPGPDRLKSWGQLI